MAEHKIPSSDSLPAHMAHIGPISAALGLRPNQVHAVISLLADGSTVPFIARYRKEATQNLDEVQIRAIGEQQAQLSERDARRQVVLQSMRSQGVLTPELEAKLMAAATRAEVEDIYLPFRPKRRTRATVAKDLGLEPLAALILAQGDSAAAAEAEGLALIAVAAHEALKTVQDAYAGAQDIIAEQVAEKAEVRQLARETLSRKGSLTSVVLADKKEVQSKFETYYDYEAPIAGLAGHRFLAMRRGEREGFLRLRLHVDNQALAQAILPMVGYRASSALAQRLQASVVDATTRLLLPSVETDVRVALKAQADREAVQVFGDNLRNLLLSAPLGEAAVVGIDPGLRTGCKCVAVAATGKFLAHTTLFLTQGEAKRAEAAATLTKVLLAHRPKCVAVGNGTGGRETESFVREVLKNPELAAFGEISVVSVNEAGASVYSASDIAREEFPELDLTVRGAISIARRLQDPLAELVKIDPKAIGVGQYQHDVHQPLLARKLDEVVESSVNHVGVALNTASAALLARVAGIGPTLALRIVAQRDAQGPYASRQALLGVAGLGARTFEQAAGFLRVDGQEPLDASAVHPERYPLVMAMARDLAVDLRQLVGSPELVKKLSVHKYVNEEVGELTLRDILQELSRPGRDPRADFTAISFKEGVNELGDLTQDMELDGIVTNVTDFGAFVDVGVHQDGLVHISQLSDRFVASPHKVVQVGQRLRVRVLEVDLVRKRIALSARKKDAAQAGRGGQGADTGGRGQRDAGPRRGHDSGQRAHPAQRPGEGRPSSTAGGRASRPAPRPDSAGAGLRHNPFAKLRPI